jgi:hypothetical protein
MTEQPTRPHPEEQQPGPLPLLGITHKRHQCGATLPYCGTPAEETPTHHATYSIVPASQQARYQDCVVCEDIWDDARVLGLTCAHCGQRLRKP